MVIVTGPGSRGAAGPSRHVGKTPLPIRRKKAGSGGQVLAFIEDCGVKARLGRASGGSSQLWLSYPAAAPGVTKEEGDACWGALAKLACHRRNLASALRY